MNMPELGQTLCNVGYFSWGGCTLRDISQKHCQRQNGPSPLCLLLHIQIAPKMQLKPCLGIDFEDSQTLFTAWEGTLGRFFTQFSPK